MTIRNATPSDIPAIIKLGRQVVEESPRYGRMTFCQERFALTLHKLIESEEGLVLVAEVDGQVVGTMLAYVSSHWISTDLSASDLGLFVTKEHRRSSLGAELVDAYVEWAHKSGAVLITAGVTTGINTEAAAALYERKGFTRCGILLEI